MESIDKLKMAILRFEKMARGMEKVSTPTPQGIREYCENEATMYRIAAACMWEKLERLEAQTCTENQEG